MGKQQLLSFDEEIEEAPEEITHVIQEEPGAQASPETEEAGSESSAGEEAGERSTAGSSDQESPAPSEGDGTEEPAGKSEPASPAADDNTGWHSSIIGSPAGRPNPYFRGIIARDAIMNNQLLIPFEDVKAISRQVFVDDIHNENPTPLTIVYRVMGSFREVAARITKEVFDEIIQRRKELRNVDVSYSYVSDSNTPRRVYRLTHPNQPTAEEIKKQDDEMDHWEWLAKPEWERKEKSENRKTKVKDEEISIQPDVAEEDESKEDAAE